jgi:cytoskeletal protein CcmA (bactofilin family)
MKNPFKLSGFDSIIAKGLTLRAATVIIGVGQTLVVDGEVFGPDIKVADQLDSKVDLKTTLIVNGTTECVNNITVPNLTVTGAVKVDMIICEGTLAIKAGAKVDANEIRYRHLVIEDGAVVLGKMAHLDHISAGEQV